MDLKEIKQHPLYPSMQANYGEKAAIKMLQEMEHRKAMESQSEVETSGDIKRILLPKGMTKQAAALELQKQWDDEENIVKVAREFEGWHWSDILVAARNVIEQEFGWINGVSKAGFFGVSRPSFIDVTVDVVGGKPVTKECFYGEIEVPIWENASVDVSPGMFVAEVKKRYADDVRSFYDAIQTELETNSIYRGKCVVVTMGEDFGGNESIEMEIIEMQTGAPIVLNSDVQSIMDNFVYDDLGTQGKRCFLFSGSYGNGKTETAMKIGAAALQLGQSFFYCKDATCFQQLLDIAKRYQPAVVFLEDIDEIASGEVRDQRMNEILNTLDGVQTKGNNLTVILTTNHENKINMALRRPGRIDLVVKFENPNPAAQEKILRAYLDHLDVEGNLDYEYLVNELPDAAGAVIAEVCKRSVRLATRKGTITNEMVVAAINSMKHHLRLLEGDTVEAPQLNMVIALKGEAAQMTDKVGGVYTPDQVVMKGGQHVEG